MANSVENISCGSFTFYNGFDSANLARVEQITDGNGVDSKSYPDGNLEGTDYEFNLWTRHDCHGTQYQNNNRTWFYFGIKSNIPGACIKLNIVNMNKQVKMFSQGMCPVFKTVPGHLHWERIREKPTYTMDQKGNDFTLSFTYRTPDNTKTVTYFAFTYPFSYSDLQNYLRKIDARMTRRTTTRMDDIYYHRECAIKSLEGRRLDVITISSFHNISMEREDRLTNMFPEETEERPYKFWNKKVVFISARVHPGETPSSFVLNGLLNLLLNREDQIAITLRRSYVFKLIPMLNPDGVARGHYRMDTRGVNLNRVYLNPSEKDHPTIYAARNLIRYYHYCYKLPENSCDKQPNVHVDVGGGRGVIGDRSGPDLAKNTAKHDTATKLLRQVTLMALSENGKGESFNRDKLFPRETTIDNKESSKERFPNDADNDGQTLADDTSGEDGRKSSGAVATSLNADNSGLYLYIDLHGHASKKGVFMYGNYFEDPEDVTTCMLLPKLMSINDPNFHFTSCNFTERNMYLIDKRDGMSREGSGRVAVYKMTGLVRSYTLECNYNSGRFVNTVPPRVRDTVSRAVTHVYVPPKYNPSVFEAVGAAIGPSILDLTNNNPNSRLPNSQYRSLRGVRSFLKLTYVNSLSGSCNKPSVHKERSERATTDSDFFGKNNRKDNAVLDHRSKITANPFRRLHGARRTVSFHTKATKISGKSRSTIRKPPRKQRTDDNVNEFGAHPVKSADTRKDYKCRRAGNYERSTSTTQATSKKTAKPEAEAMKVRSRGTRRTREKAVCEQGAKRPKTTLRTHGHDTRGAGTVIARHERIMVNLSSHSMHKAQGIL